MDDHVQENYDKITVCEDAVIYMTAVVEELYIIIYGLASKSDNKISSQLIKDVVDANEDLKETFAKALYLYDKEDAYKCDGLDADIMDAATPVVFTGKGKQFLSYLFDYIFDEIIHFCVVLKKYSEMTRITCNHVKSAIDFVFIDSICKKLQTKADKTLELFTTAKANLPKKKEKKADETTDKPVEASTDKTATDKTATTEPVKKKRGKKAAAETDKVVAVEADPKLAKKEEETVVKPKKVNKIEEVTSEDETAKGKTTKKSDKVKTELFTDDDISVKTKKPPIEEDWIDHLSHIQ